MRKNRNSIEIKKLNKLREEFIKDKDANLAFIELVKKTNINYDLNDALSFNIFIKDQILIIDKMISLLKKASKNKNVILNKKDMNQYKMLEFTFNINLLMIKYIND